MSRKTMLFAACVFSLALFVLLTAARIYRKVSIIERLRGDGHQVHTSPGVPSWLSEHLSDDLNCAFSNVDYVMLLEGSSDTTLSDLSIFKRIGQLVIDSGGISPSGFDCLRNFDRIRYLHLDGAHLTSKSADAVFGTPGLQSLRLADCNLPPDSLSRISQASSLRSLSFDGTQLAQDDLASISQLPNLESLSLENVGLTDGDLSYLKLKSDRLTKFSLNGNPLLSDFGFLTGPRFQNLEELLLNKTGFSDRSSVALEGFKVLTKLELSETEISDETLASIGKLTSLQFLDIYGTQVTDRGIENLSDLRNLVSLDVHDTEVTREGLEVIHENSPACEVVYGKAVFPHLLRGRELVKQAME